MTRLEIYLGGATTYFYSEKEPFREDVYYKREQFSRLKIVPE